MSFKHIARKYPRDGDFPERTQLLNLRKKLLNGTFYDRLPHLFHEEKTAAGLPIPLSERQPSSNVGTNLLRTVVNDAVGMLFGEGRFPVVDSQSKETRETVHALIKEANLVSVMRDAAYRGSIGSVAILMRVLSQRVFFDVFDTLFLTPIWKADEPDVLARMIEAYKVDGHQLVELGYTIAEDDLDKKFWFRREWDSNREIWFKPWLVHRDDDKPHVPVEDASRTVTHNLGFCPWVWIRNLHGGDGPDGGCTFDAGIETGIQIDYQVSQAGRALRYGGDPMLVIKEPPAQTVWGASGMDETPMLNDPHPGIQVGAANALTIDPTDGGDAKFLEIKGDASAAVLAYVQWLRDQSLEAMGGNRSKPDAINSHQGARALEILHAPLIRLCEHLRASYGEQGLLRLLKLFQKAVAVRGAIIRVNGKPVPQQVASADDLSLRWGSWFAPTAEDLKQMADALATMVKGGFLSRESATKIIAIDFDIEDIAAERALIEAEQRALAAMVASQEGEKALVGTAE